MLFKIWGQSNGVVEMWGIVCNACNSCSFCKVRQVDVTFVSVYLINLLHIRTQSLVTFISLLDIIGGPEKGQLVRGVKSLLGAGVLGDGLGALRHSVLGQLSGQQQPDGGLDLPGGDGGPLVVVGELAGLGGDPLEQVVDEAVHDAHGLGGDSGVRVHLL